MVAFAGKVALVTGAAGGIGRAVARRLAADGAMLTLVDREATADLPDAVGAPGGLALSADLGDAGAVEGIVPQVLDRFVRLDMLVNIAGIMIFKPVEEQTADDWQRLLAINLVAPALLCGRALRHMPAGGSIVNVSSVHARRTTPLVSSYAASKAAMSSLTRSVAIEGRPMGIRCNAVLPGAIDTPLLHASPAIKSGAEQLDWADVGQAEDIAALTAFLLSDEARFITGEEIVADAGRMARL